MIERMSKKHPLNKIDSFLDFFLMLIFLTPKQSILINPQAFSDDGRMSRVVK
tara:strand:- start:152 stop:307 length:156 start_codon:yes stop_codon:yes gene_type:complete